MVYLLKMVIFHGELLVITRCNYHNIQKPWSIKGCRCLFLRRWTFQIPTYQERVGGIHLAMFCLPKILVTITFVGYMTHILNSPDFPPVD